MLYFYKSHMHACTGARTQVSRSQQLVVSKNGSYAITYILTHLQQL